MSSKQVIDRQRSAESVIAVGDAQAKSIGDTLNPMATPHLKPGQSADFGGAVLALVAALEGAKQRMVDADEAHQAELGDDGAVRQERDAAAAALHDHIVVQREVITGLYGPTVSMAVFNGSTPDDPVILSRFAGDAANKLDTMTFPAPRVQGAALDPKQIAAELRALRATLDKALRAVQREVREAQVTQQAREDALDGYDMTFSGVATALSGLLRLAGKPELAAKVRPSVRRPGVIEGDGEAPVEAAPPA